MRIRSSSPVPFVLAMMMLQSLLVLFLLGASLPTFRRPFANAQDVVSDLADINLVDGPVNLQEGQRLFQLGNYNDAAAYLWRAVVLHPKSVKNKDLYQVDDAFKPFLQCYLLQNRLVDGFVFIATESYMRGQNDMGDLYLGQALERDAGHAAALELQQVMKGNASIEGKDAWKFKRLKDIRDAVDLSNSNNQQQLQQTKEESGRSSWSEYTDEEMKMAFSSTSTINTKTPEEIYNIASFHFNHKNLPYAAQLFQLSCDKSNNKLAVACTNAVYLRTNLCD